MRVAAPPPERVRTVVELDDRKAEAGLGEVYEQDYLAATGKVAATGDKAEPLREEARRLFKVRIGWSGFEGSGGGLMGSGGGLMGSENAEGHLAALF